VSAPYYQDDLVTLYHGKAEDVLPSLTPGSVDVLLTDPPYFNFKDEDWDRQWREREHFLAWLVAILDATSPLLTPAASLWMFASHQMIRSIEHEVIAPRFRILNSIRWVKAHSQQNKTDPSMQRSFLTNWEGIVFAEQKEAIGAYIRQERLRAGMSTNDVEVALGLVEVGNPARGTRLVYRWEQGDSTPTADAYNRLRAVLGEGYLSRAYSEVCRPFAVRRDAQRTDVWNFQTVMSYPGKHPCEKPLPLLRHMLDTSARPGALILDPFAGSGSTLRAAKDAGLRAIGVEQDRRWCEFAARRLAQEALDLGESA
jgi:adenine-specific DNA-methyltransferase